MMDSFSLTATEWGMHAVVHKALSAAGTSRAVAAMQEAADRLGASGRGWSIILDLRAADDGYLTSAHAQALFALMKRAEVTRCSSILGGLQQAAVLDRAARERGVADKLRSFDTDGRDRMAVAAAYKWALNGTEPAVARPVEPCKPAKPAKGAILPFVSKGKPGAAPMPELRKAS